MRKLIKTQKLHGTLTLFDKYVFENVRGEYQYDFYSNKDMKGFFEIPSLPVNFHKDLRSNDKLIFNGDGISITGEVQSWSLGSTIDSISFKINEVTSHIFWRKGTTKKMEISYYIPYASILAREIKTNWGLEKEYIVKFDNDEFTISVKNYTIRFYENINLVKYKEPDSIFHRMLYPKIEVEIKNEENVYNKLNELENFMIEVMTLISFLLFHRINIFGYDVNIFDEQNELSNRIEHRFTKKQSGIDVIHEYNSEFNKFFTKENVSKLIDAFINLDTEPKQKFIRVIYAFLTIGDHGIFETKFKDAYFALEAISKIIVQPTQGIGSEDLIVLACSKANVNLDLFEFQISRHKGKLKWLISEYRNELTHFNFNTNYDIPILIIEFEKVMNLLRKLMIYYLTPDLIAFPYPEDKYKFR